ncbi:hypothetical protein F2P58_09350 [Vibrio fortis]|uniref:Uncharacterized protein n=1 Tax=Vibrio fortis TaxID=212667 RepID=A0A5N3R4D9_9VIBR|nr:hypothetical protein [Vibrio fortis]KAB0289276.1 hypothetical protein F2P58_09350 [Vibrio fortis]
MKDKKLYIVSDWSTFSVAEAHDHYSALEKVYASKNYRLIPRKELSEYSVSHAMSCEYTRENMAKFNNCPDETGIVLLMDQLAETHHYQLTDAFYA